MPLEPVTPGATQPSSGPPAVSAAVVNYNAKQHLLACVASLRAEGVREIVVADNASSDGSREALAAADPGAVFLATGANLGFGSGANRAVAATSGAQVLVLNPDTVVQPGTVAALSRALDRDPGLAVVGPRVHNPDGSLYPSVRRFPAMGLAAGHAFLGMVAPDNRFTRRYRMLDWDHDRAGEVDWVAGTAILVRRSAFEAVGGFDERYFMYVEDVDLCWRLRQKGWKVGYEPAGVVVHTIGVSSQLAPYRMILAHHRSLLRFASETTSGAGRLMLPAVAVGLGLRTVLAWAQHRLDRQPPASR
ncbi:MAG: glycosyltransferase family 2 protein [Acidimicrobiales bacterium]